MAENDPLDGNDFEEILRQLFGAGGANFDPEQFQRLTGMNVDPAMMAQMMRSMQGAFRDAKEGIDWEAAQRQALHIANQGSTAISDGRRADLDQAFALANLWLSDKTTISELTDAPRTLSRGQWVEHTMPVWQELAEPVATSITDALLGMLTEHAPEEMQSIVSGAGRVMRSIGGSLFATQLGQVVGRLSAEVVAGGDVGIPLLPAGEAAIMPQNFADFKVGLEVADDQLALYLGTRELAHARLFRHAKWLRLHVITQVTEYARGLRVDPDAIEEVARNLDPSDPEQLRSALESGALLPRQSSEQAAALSRLENLLAVIEGWVEVVTSDATTLLPEALRIGEAVRRRRGTGSPAEKALGALVGLEIRPRRLREATAMWRAITEAVGVAARDSLWDYPDFLPTGDDIDDPSALIARLRGDDSDQTGEFDEIDDAIAKLLAGDETTFIEAEDGTVTERVDSSAEASTTNESADDEGDGSEDSPEDEPPHGPTPV